MQPGGLPEAAVAWMRMMGADSVAYHRDTVLGRGDDHPGAALAYYASRGETPLVWGGRGAAALGLRGPVTDAQYEALFGPGGARDPTTGRRLVTTRRPGMELVISAHKSVAELGVIGRADDMHRIMDAELDATLAYLDDLTTGMGGRRGRAARRAPTEGLLYAVTRHATSRAGDPCPHDHVLVANVVRMADDAGGWKAADTALWREHLHAATATGRLAAAREAVEAGYAIVADPGPSGRLGQWAVAGVPPEVMAVHSKRGAEIAAEVARLGTDSYRARNVAARTTRHPKRHTPVGDLLPRWVAEIEQAGWSVEAVNAAVERAAAERVVSAPQLDGAEARALVAELLEPEGPLGARKVFCRRDVVVAAAPLLFGRDPAELARVVEQVVAHPEAVALLGVAGAHERAYATATTIAREQAIAATVAAQVGRRDAAVVSHHQAREAMARAEASLGHPLTAGQRRAVGSILTSGRGVDLVVGVAGSGKTTALAAARDGFEAAGFTVVGTSTSGQAARTLGREAGIDPSRTLASLLWRLRHGTLTLTRRHVAVLDEAAMTDDAALLAFLEAARTAGAKVVAVGDPRQLGAVGPGGGFEALVARFGAAVSVMGENVRQLDGAERAALEQLRAGDVGEAVAFYTRAGRIAVAPDRDAALDAVVEGWAVDVVHGHRAAMYAWRRANVAELNRRARQVWAEAGRLRGPELAGPTPYRAGDRIVTLAPGAGGRVVTSECGTVAAVDVGRRELVVTMDDGRTERLAGCDLDADHLAHGYALTVHRAQGGTVARAHALEDGGGRELAYVKMSRARERSTVYVVADDVAQAADDLARDWRVSRRIGWAIDAGTPDPGGGPERPAAGAPADPALRLARLRAEREALAAAMPEDSSTAVADAEARVRGLEQAVRELDDANGRGRWRGTAIGEAAVALSKAVGERKVLTARAEDASPRERRELRAEAARMAEHEIALRVEFERVAGPARAELETELHDARQVLGKLEERELAHRRFHLAHPEAADRLEALDCAIGELEVELGVAHRHFEGVAAEMPWGWDWVAPQLETGMEIDYGP